MAERIRPSADWYRRMILRLPEREYLIGPAAIHEHAEASQRSQTTVAFGTLLRLQRRHLTMTVSQLARALDVEEDEVRCIEHDPAYQARPRTIVGIAKFFKLPLLEVKKLAGAVASNDPRFTEEAMRFAAHSDDIGALSMDERELLRSFLEFLKDHN